MPSSALLQLVARGKQDAYLTGTPQVNFFRHVFRRYTNYAIESIPIEFDGTPNFGQRITAIIPHKGDLVSKLFLEVDLPPLPTDSLLGPAYWVNDIGHAMIEEISIEIKDIEIDKHTGEWLHIWSELTTPLDKRSGFNEMIGHWEVFPPPPSVFDPSAPIHLSIPLRFWFCNSIGAALPLISLSRSTVRIHIKLRAFNDLWWAPPGECPTRTPIAPSRIQLFGDFVFLDKEQQSVFKTLKHAYLIDQLQITPPETVAIGINRSNIALHFNHCCKEFIWVIQQERIQAAREWFNYSNTLQADGGEVGIVETDLLDSAVIRLDGQERFQRRNAQYFRITQPYQYHTAIPAYVYTYSFSLHPEDEQPSGSINCSKINDIQLSLAYPPAQLRTERRVSVFALNYNVLFIQGGLAGLAFIA